MMEEAQFEKILEAVLFASDQPLTIERFKDILSIRPTDSNGGCAEGSGQAESDQSAGEGGGQETLEADILKSLEALRAKYGETDSPVVVLEVAGGWQFAANPKFSPWLKRLYKNRTTYRLSQAAMETLAIISYKQPITRAEIEEIRGVEAIASLETLLERNLIRTAGRKETIGRPILYATSQEFLRQFGLRNLKDLPSLEELAGQDKADSENSQESAGKS
ncbi:MAG: SMC-Scp complex subunit ScpB [Elusimicrobia bacterium]|nr:SMC-Scp complex subunit ScpB [Elusimicrobiota bacterium]